jgi:hypothetical protein
MNKILIVVNSLLLLIISILYVRFENITHEQKFQICSLEWQSANLKFRVENCEKSLGH